MIYEHFIGYFCEKKTTKVLTEMKKHSDIKNIDELFPLYKVTNPMRKKINSMVFYANDVRAQLSSQIYINASVTLLVLSGNASLCANFRKYPIERNSIALLSVLHLFQIENCSDDFSCICLFVSKTFMEEMDPTEMIYVRTKYGVRMYSSPVIKIEEKDAELLKMRVDEINRSLDNEEHYYYKQMILSSVIAFFLDMSNLIEHNLQNLAKDVGLSRYEKLTKSFIELLTTNYRQEHSVNFYAKKLNITAHYLTLIVKQITGQSVSEFIFEMLYSDSRMLLVQSKLSIQEIAALLHFSDQSSFGKFFKRRSGHSPFSYRGKTEE